LGDKDQLASVEAGAVMGDLCLNAQMGGYTDQSSQYITDTTGQSIASDYLGHASPLAQQTVMLRHSHRFTGPISALAIAVNQGATTDASQCLRAGPVQQNILSWQEQAQTEHVLQLCLHGRSGTLAGYHNYLELLASAPMTKDKLEYEIWVSSVLQAFEGFRILCAVREGEWGVSGINQAIENGLAVRV